VKTSPKRSYSVIENERIGLVFAKTVSIISGIGIVIPLAEVSGRKDDSMEAFIPLADYTSKNADYVPSSKRY
jgi:hypothetical protein